MTSFRKSNNADPNGQATKAMPSGSQSRGWICVRIWTVSSNQKNGMKGSSGFCSGEGRTAIGFECMMTCSNAHRRRFASKYAHMPPWHRTVQFLQLHTVGLLKHLQRLLLLFPQGKQDGQRTYRNDSLAHLGEVGISVLVPL